MKSMTAYAEGSAHCPQGRIHWVIRSVNHRYLDGQFRLPDDFRHLEIPLRQKLKERLSRGKVEANLHFTPDSGQIARSMTLNPAMVDQLSGLVNALGKKIDEVDVDLAHLLHWPGLIDHQQVDWSPAYEASVALFDEVLEAFVASRVAEGEAIRVLLEQRLDGVQTQIDAVRAHAPTIRAHLEEKIRTKLTALEVDVDPGRLEQELVFLLQKSDVDEELDRLMVHVAEMRRIMAREEACGRRLDFLIQELNREANTLGSKASLVETSQASVELKVLIEQLKEQIQNIE